MLSSADVVAAQGYPAKSIRFVALFAAGGALDTRTRTIAAHMQESWGQAVLVENRSGADGNIGAKAAPDGYTFVMGTVATHAFIVSLHSTMP